MIAYHLSERIIQPNTVITKGVYGEKIINPNFVEQQYNRYIKEQIFEEVRKLNYPNLPSRLNCVFLFPNLEEAHFYWAKEMHYQAYLYEVEVDESKTTIVEMDLLRCDGASFDVIKNNAHKYWKQEKHSPSFTLEMLTESDAVVRKLILPPSKL